MPELKLWPANCQMGSSSAAAGKAPEGERLMSFSRKTRQAVAGK